MAIKAKYVHTNLIARDWKKPVRFYGDVFGCDPTGPERDLSGEWLDRVNRFLRRVSVVFTCVCLDMETMARRSRFSVMTTCRTSNSRCRTNLPSRTSALR